MVGAIPGLKRGCLAAERGVVHLVLKSERGGGRPFPLEVGFDIVLDVENEPGRYC